MARSTHEKQLARARARRREERAERRRATTIVLSVVGVLVVATIALAGVLWLRGGDDDVADPAPVDASGQAADDAAAAATDASTAADDVGVEPCPSPRDVPDPRAGPYDVRPTADLGGSEVVTATVTTTCGEIVLALDAAGAPVTVENFVALAEDDYYDGVGFHRVVDGFMIQGGDPTGTGTGCVDASCETRLPGYGFDDELSLAEQVVAEEGGYPRGTLAMANAGADTNGSQFFIVQSREPYPLPPQYTVFGEVVEGLDVVDRIAAGPVQGQLAVDPAVITDVDVQRCAPSDC